MAAKFLINPMAGSFRGPRLWSALQAACTRLGYVEGKDFTLEWTHAKQLAEQARQAAVVYDRVFAVGGDGTVRQVAQGLLEAGTDTALGVIPQGIGNDFSRAIGVYGLWRQQHKVGIETIIDWLMIAPTASVDVLTVNGCEPFLSYASIGFDARLCRTYGRIRKQVKGMVRGRTINECICAVVALRYCLTRLPALQLSLDIAKTGEIVKEIPPGTCAVVISNIPCYAGGAYLARETCYHDGEFEITVIPWFWLFPVLVASRLWPRLRDVCRLPSWRARSARLLLPYGHAIQLDGDDCTESLTAHSSLNICVAGQIPVVVGPGWKAAMPSDNANVL